jgi:hypothetical protein
MVRQIKGATRRLNLAATFEDFVSDRSAANSLAPFALADDDDEIVSATTATYVGCCENGAAARRHARVHTPRPDLEPVRYQPIQYSCCVEIFNILLRCGERCVSYLIELIAQTFFGTAFASACVSASARIASLVSVNPNAQWVDVLGPDSGTVVARIGGLQQPSRPEPGCARRAGIAMPVPVLTVLPFQSPQEDHREM